MESERTLTCRPEVDIRDRVTVGTDATLSEAMARLRIERPDQAALEINHDLNRPVRYELREAKLRNKAKSLLGEVRAERIWEIISSSNSSCKPLIDEIFNG